MARRFPALTKKARSLVDAMIEMQRLKDEARHAGVDFTKVSFTDWMRTHKGEAS